MKKKLIISITALSMIIVGVTYAWYTWAIQFDISGTAQCFDVEYVKGRDIGSNENRKTLILGNNYYDGLSSTVEVKLKDTCEIENGKGILYLNTENTTSSVLLTGNILKYQVINGNNLVTSGVINSTGRTIIYDDFDITKEETNLIIFVWLDGNLVTEDNYGEVIAATYSGNISLEVESR